MALPYLLRLVCLCLASFFIVHAAAAILVWIAAPAALRVADSARPGFSARFLFIFRMFPFALTLILVVGFCIPSYLWLEPVSTGEKVGYACLAAATMGALVWAMSLFRVGFSLLRTSRYMSSCERDGQEIAVDGESSPVLVLKREAPVMAVAGLVHPKLIVSRSVLHKLTSEQRDAAFRHEQAHRSSRDNLKRFLCLLAPDAIPFVSGFKKIERQWARYTEWAADDHAVNGDSERALSLAAALVSVAKMGRTHHSSYVLSLLVAEDEDLAVRVDRLLREQQYAERPLAPLVQVARNVALVAGGLILAALVLPNSLGSVHQILEKLIQ
jgi:beta-lactamase regulating signal transducer with metallopeptidase domain